MRAWADALRAGHVDQATRFFAIPAFVANASPPIELTTRSEVRAFNESLPCGARVASTKRGPRGFTIVTFVLTERPGPGVCGRAVGQTARTAFRVRNGRITDWLRLEDIPSAPATQV